MKTVFNAGVNGPATRRSHSAALQRLSVTLVVLFGILGTNFAQDRPSGSDPSSAAGRKWAILIGIEAYEKANPLPYTVNDVERLSETLRKRGGYRRDCVLEMKDKAVNPKYRPSRENIMNELSTWLKKPGPNDTVVVFFSGHGFRDAAGKMYLAPIDCDPSNAASTGIPVAWFRDQIAACKAGVKGDGLKLLILDACHAGSEKGEGDNDNVTAKDLEVFRDLEGVVTLASSTADQKSQIWEEKEQSLFSYWLNEGLKGHADEDADGIVDIDELNKYVYRNVTVTAKNRFPRPQTPVRIVRTGTRGAPGILRLQPQPLKQVLADMAGQLCDAMEAQHLKRVGVLEFTNDTKLGELLGADYGLLGRYCAEELERRLVKMGQGHFGVLDQRRLQQALKAQRFTLADLGSGESLKELSKKAGGLPAIAQGTLKSRAGRIVTLQCKLLQTDSDDLAGSVGGTAVLDESEWAMLGKSVSMPPEARQPQLAPAQPGQETPSPQDEAVRQMDDKSQGAHPLSDPKFPFRVSIRVGNEVRKLVFKGNDCFAPVRKGEHFEVWVENRTGKDAMMRLLVDGLNTLPEPEGEDPTEKKPDEAPPESPQPQATKGIVTEIVAKRVNLADARAWVLDPKQPLNRIIGFVTQTGENGKMDLFTVVDAEKSLAARQNFTDSIGIITVAFYEKGGGTRSLFGVDRGPEVSQNLTEAAGRCGALLGVVHIRYVDADTLPEAGK